MARLWNWLTGWLKKTPEPQRPKRHVWDDRPHQSGRHFDGYCSAPRDYKISPGAKVPYGDGRPGFRVSYCGKEQDSYDHPYPEFCPVPGYCPWCGCRTVVQGESDA